MFAHRISFPRLLQIILIAAIPIQAGISGRITPALATSGMPDSMEFGYGAVIDPWGFEPELAMNVADGIGLDWIAIEYNWARLTPSKETSPSIQELDETFALAQRYGMNVLLSISNPPSWAVASLGPDVAHVNNLVVMLATRYKGGLLALELFPYANTNTGWGTKPNPAAYVAMIQQVNTTLASLQSKILVVAGGLASISPSEGMQGVDDLKFLHELYEAGAAQHMPILSLHLENLVGDAIASPGLGELRVLRHYEAVRQIMLNHGHETGLLWITGYTWPSQLSQNPPESQVDWLNQALQLMKSQLYIGASFYNRINSSNEEGPSAAGQALIASQAQQVILHPALSALAQTIAFSRGDKPPILQFQLSKRLVSGPHKRTLKIEKP